MSKAEVVANTPSPRTRESLAADLRALGVAPGMVVLVHSSLRSLGWVCGGPVAVVQALTDAVTEAGTLAMPTHSGDYCTRATTPTRPGGRTRRCPGNGGRSSGTRCRPTTAG